MAASAPVIRREDDVVDVEPLRQRLDRAGEGNAVGPLPRVRAAASHNASDLSEYRKRNERHPEHILDPPPRLQSVCVQRHLAGFAAM